MRVVRFQYFAATLGCLGLFSVTSIGCGPARTQVDAADYEASCTADADCILVFEGDACDRCRCPNVSIRASEGTAHADDLMDAADRCPTPTPNLVTCAPCEGVEAVCDGGMCAARAQ